VARNTSLTAKVKKTTTTILSNKEHQTMTTLLTRDEKELLERAANLMEEILETVEVSQDKTIAKELKAALQEIEEGKTRPISELIAELGLENDVPT
jgi:Trp operon repressor